MSGGTDQQWNLVWLDKFKNKRYERRSDVHRVEIRELFAWFINQFLTNGTFKVKLRGILLSIKEINTGVPQGCLLSATPFALKINSLAAKTSSEIFKYMLVYDLLVAYCGGNPTETEHTLQAIVNSLSK